MKKLPGILIFLAMLLTSCEFDFDVEGKGEAALFVNCICSPDSCRVDLARAVPVGSQVETAHFAPSAFNVSVNGDAAISGDGVIYFPHGLVSGDEISVHIECAGYEPVDAVTVMPGRFELDSLSLSVEDIQGVKLNMFTLHMDRQPSEDEFVGVIINRNVDALIDGDWDNGTTFNDYASVMPIIGASTDPTLEMAQVNYPVISEYDMLTLIPGKAFKEGRVTLSEVDFSDFESPYMYDDFEIDDDYEEPEILDTRISYDVILMGVSEEFFRYSLARYKSERDFLAMMGLAPAQFAWSNIKNGFGVFAAINPVYKPFLETDILILPDE